MDLKSWKNRKMWWKNLRTIFKNWYLMTDSWTEIRLENILFSQNILWLLSKSLSSGMPILRYLMVATRMTFSSSKCAFLFKSLWWQSNKNLYFDHIFGWGRWRRSWNEIWSKLKVILEPKNQILWTLKMSTESKIIEQHSLA